MLDEKKWIGKCYELHWNCKSTCRGGRHQLTIDGFFKKFIRMIWVRLINVIIVETERFRSHEVKPEGYEIHHGGKCVTVFSAPNYWYSDSLYFYKYFLNSWYDWTVIYREEAAKCVLYFHVCYSLDFLKRLASFGGKGRGGRKGDAYNAWDACGPVMLLTSMLVERV